MTNDNVKNDNDCRNSNLSPKERLEMFQSSIQQLEQQSEIKNVRQLLHERYMQSKAENQVTNNQTEEKVSKDVKKSNDGGGGNRIKIGRQMARVFRFETGNNNNLRNRRNPRHQPNEAREHEIDPLLNDPNVLFENFAFDNNNDDRAEFRDWDDDDDNNEHHRPDLPFFPDQAQDGDDEDDDDNDDSFRSLILSTFRLLTWRQWSFWIICLTLYATGQWQANRYGFGAPFLMISLLLFIIINLRRKTPGELSAYSVFNPNCRPIASVASNDQPREQILLGFGPL